MHSRRTREFDWFVFEPWQTAALAFIAAANVLIAVLILIGTWPSWLLWRGFLNLTYLALTALALVGACLVTWLGFTHRRAAVIPDEAVRDLTRHIEKGDYVEAMAVCAARPSGLGPVVFEALYRRDRGRASALEAVETQSRYETLLLVLRAEWLILVARVAVLLGAAAFVLRVIRYFDGLYVMRCGGYDDPMDVGATALAPLGVSLVILVAAAGAGRFFRRRAERLGAEIRAVAGAILDYVLSDPRSAAYAEACERARAAPVFRRVRVDEGMLRIDAPRLRLGDRISRDRPAGLARLMLCACAASVIVLGGLSGLRLVAAEDFLRGALTASFWLTGVLGAASVGLALATLIAMRRRAPGSFDARRGGKPARIQRMAEWLPLIGRTALLVGVLGVVVAIMREVEAIHAITYFVDLPGLLARSSAPLALALSVFVFAAVAGRVLRNRAGRLCAEVRPARTR